MNPITDTTCVAYIDEQIGYNLEDEIGHYEQGELATDCIWQPIKDMAWEACNAAIRYTQ